MSFAGPKSISNPPLLRRAEQTGIIQRNFPARWLALLLMGSVGAAWALSPDAEDGKAPALMPTSKTVVEGDPQVVSQLMGSLLGEAPSLELQSPMVAGGRRIVLESRAVPGSRLLAQREKAQFLRAVEDVEAEYMASGKYPAAPPGADGATMSYRTDGDEFALEFGHRRYTASQGLTFGAAPATGMQFELKGFLLSKTGGWGPWAHDYVALEPGPGVQSVEGLGFLEGLPQGQRGSARMFFPVDRETCGFLFRRVDGSSIYSSGELTYDAVSGSFSLKLFRAGEVARHDLSATALEKELAHRDSAVVMVGEAPMLADLGFSAAPKKGEDVLVLSSSVPLSCSVGSSLDGLRMAALERHKDVLSGGQFGGEGATEAGVETAGRASVVGRVRMADKLGQVHHLRVRGGRGANYDWLVGQVCPEQEEAPVAGFVDSQAVSCEDAVAPDERVVKAGR